MEITLGSGYRITIPREIRDQLQLVEGSKLYMDIQDNKIVISFNEVKQESQITEDEEEVKVSEIKEEQSKKQAGVRKIISNLEEGKKFSRKVYSDCGLVIRTKRSYMNKFCEDCQGQLAYEYGILDHPCKYINIPERIEIEEPKLEKSKPVKTIMQKLTDNVKKLDKSLDKKINKIEKGFP